MSKKTVTVTISTKDRYFTTLPLTLLSICQQTKTPDYLIIFDDGEQKDLREYSVYESIFKLFDEKTIQWKVVFGKRTGQVSNHQMAIDNCESDFIWRLDDDTCPEPNVLQRLYYKLNSDDNIGAVAGLVIDPKSDYIVLPSIASNNIEHIHLGCNIQWFKHNNIKNIEVEHLYSSFLFRVEAAKHGYCMELSPVGHREETIFTYEMKRAGWRLIVLNDVITWHFRETSGGIRSYESEDYWKHDEFVFSKKLEEWHTHSKNQKLFVLDSGLGDHYIFKKIFPKIKKMYGQTHRIVL